MQIHSSYGLALTCPLPWTQFFVCVLICLFALFCFFGGIQHFPVNGYSVTSYNFGTLTGKDEFTHSSLPSSLPHRHKLAKGEIPISQLCTFFTFLHCQIGWKPMNRAKVTSSLLGCLCLHNEGPYLVMTFLSRDESVCDMQRASCAPWWADPRQHYPRAFL